MLAAELLLCLIVENFVVRFRADNDFPDNYRAEVINRLMHLDDTLVGRMC